MLLFLDLERRDTLMFGLRSRLQEDILLFHLNFTAVSRKSLFSPERSSLTISSILYYSPNALQSAVLRLIHGCARPSRRLKSKKAARPVTDFLSVRDKGQRYLMQTSQATDLRSGGVKINALPENGYAVVNHRVAVESRVADIRSNLQSLIETKIFILGVRCLRRGFREHFSGCKRQDFPGNFR